MIERVGKRRETHGLYNDASEALAKTIAAGGRSQRAAFDAATTAASARTAATTQHGLTSTNSRIRVRARTGANVQKRVNVVKRLGHAERFENGSRYSHRQCACDRLRTLLAPPDTLHHE